MLSGVLSTTTPHNIFSKPLAAFPYNHCGNNDSNERGMNPVTMSIIKSPPSQSAKKFATLQRNHFMSENKLSCKTRSRK